MRGDYVVMFFSLVIGVLVLSRWNEFNGIITSGNAFAIHEAEILQGRGIPINA